MVSPRRCWLPDAASMGPGVGAAKTLPAWASGRCQHLQEQ